jgi:ankyrin repeat protein
MPLLLAAGEDRLDVVRYLLDQGADVNAREQDGHTAITEAAFYGNTSVIKELLIRGADVNAITGEGTALDIALKSNSVTVIDLLKHYGGKRACEIRGTC